jgi:hypothetical protein
MNVLGYLRQLLREPLLHFLVLGAGLFVVYSWIGDDTFGIDGKPEIVVTPGRTDTLAQTFERVWQRPPTETEMDGLIENFIHEEVLYREALALGLDRDDTIVRRRMRQKLEFIAEDVMSISTPTEQDLIEYLNTHEEMFRIDPQVSFSQVYLNPDRRGDSIHEDAERLLGELRTQGTALDITTLGDSLMLERRFTSTSRADIERLFGPDFVRKLLSAPTRSWHGPIRSGYGLHLVYLSDRVEGRMPSLDEVRKAVEREWSSAKRRESNEAFYTKLLDGYTVTIEKLDAPEAPNLAVGKVVE